MIVCLTNEWELRYIYIYIYYIQSLHYICYTFYMLWELYTCVCLNEKGINLIPLQIALIPFLIGRLPFLIFLGRL
jgi:hypothetical protein